MLIRKAVVGINRRQMYVVMSLCRKMHDVEVNAIITMTNCCSQYW